MDSVGILEVRRPGASREYLLCGHLISLGRAADNAVALDDASVSRHHARIAWVDGRPYLTDLESVNGTLVNGARLEPNVPVRLGTGDRIVIVDLEMTWREPSPGQAERKDVSGQPLPGDKPGLLIGAEPAEVTLAVQTPHGEKRYPLGQQQITIGRDPASDICIDEPAVSWRHARLERVSAGYRIVDLGSTNGLDCREVQVAQMRLAHGDVLWIGGRVSLAYEIIPLAPEAAAEPPRVAEVPAPADVALPPAGETPAVGVALEERAAPPGATMLGEDIVTGGLQKIDLRDKTELTIGRSPDNDLHLDFPTVSRHHARIRCVGSAQEYVIEDLRSSNGTIVNDEFLEAGKLYPLYPGSTIRIGPMKLIFAPGVMELVDESRDLRLHALHLNQFVGKGVNLLQDISLAILPREFVALVGVSGAGKSTLMNALAGFWPASDGVVLVNGEDLYRRFDAFRTDLGYVPQDDIIHKELTAERALQYVARLRLPADMTSAERKEAVAQELKTLGLLERKDVRVGSLSGGQRKRVSIGVERLTRPGLFFLDEATSGLDPGTENRLMRLLRQLADSGQTIVLITHATKNVMLCDQVIFLAKGGRLAYYGPPDQALKYFGVEDFDEIYEQLEDERSPEEWAEGYRQSPQYEEYVVQRLGGAHGRLPDVRAEHGSARAGKAARKASLAPPRTKVKQPSAFRQLWVLTARYFEIIRSDRMNLLLMLLLAPVLGSMDLILWPRDAYDPITGKATDVMRMLFLTAVIPFLVGALSSVREIVKERAIYRRERAVNLRIIPYLLSKTGVGFLFALYHAAVLLGLKLVAVDFSHLGLEQFGLFYLFILLAVMSGVMWGLLISAVAPREEQAILIAIVLVVIQLVFSGGILPLDQLGTAGDVVGGATSSKWVYQALVDVTEVERGECAGPSLDRCDLPGVQAQPTDDLRRLLIDQLEGHYGDVLDGDAATSLVATLAIMVVLFILLVVIQKRKDVI